MPGERRICVYIVTYKKPEVLAENLRTLYAGLTAPDDVSVTVLSNHPEVEIPDDLPAQPRVVINATRPTNAWGYLSRDWNWGLLDCFGTWRGSAAEWCVLAQNDVTWLDEWDKRLSAMTDYDFITQPTGDQAMAFRIAAVRAIGFFDERFSTLHYQEQDYFLRAILALGGRAAINDDHHPWSSWCPTGEVITHRAMAGFAPDDDTLHTTKTHYELGNLLLNKWGAYNVDQLWDRELFRTLVNTGGIKIPGELDLYPFFWDEFPGERELSPLYEPADARYGLTVVVRSDEDAGELRACLGSLAERFGSQKIEVIVSAPRTPDMERVEADTSGDFRFILYDEPHDPVDVERRIKAAALGPHIHDLTNRDRV
jgi:hypothetical protein